MSTEQRTPSAPPAGAVAVYTVDRPGAGKEVDHVVYGHSNLFYWWPVWLVCFVLAGVTYAGGAEPGLPGDAVRGNAPGAVFVVTLLAVALSSTVLLRG
jgi:hypothetical protein